MKEPHFDIDEFQLVCTLCRQYGVVEGTTKQGEPKCFLCRRRHRVKKWLEYMYEGSELGVRTFERWNRRTRTYLNRLEKHGRKNKEY